MVKVESLVKCYHKFTAVDGINFTIKKGEIFGLLGPNGAGKTSTISILACLHKPTSGLVKIDGYDVTKEDKKVKSIIGVVPQELSLYPTLTAWDNLAFFSGIYGLKGKQLKERISEVLAIVGLSERAKDSVATFSGGMKRRLNLACGLLHLPKLLLMDEPTVGIDPQSRNLIFENIRLLNKEHGMTILYTTHYMEEAEALCDRVAVMDQGTIIADDTPKALIARHGGGIIEMIINRTSPELETAIKNNALVHDVSLLDSKKIKIESSQTYSAIVDILTLLKKYDVELEKLYVQEANLENVFLKLTGKSLRDSLMEGKLDI